MRWSVSTLHGTIGPGTSFCVIESPQVEGGPYAKPAAGDDFPIEMAAGDWKSGKVIHASDDELIIEVEGQSKWRLTSWTSSDLKVPINTPGLYSTYWVVRSAA